MANTLGSILTVSALLVIGSQAQFNPRFQPAFAPPPFSQQRNPGSFSEFNSIGMPQMPVFGPPGRMGMGPSPPYGSPLFNSNSMNELAFFEQQQMLGPMAQMAPSAAFHRRPSFAQFGANPSMFPPSSPMMMRQPVEFGSLPPAFQSLPQSMGGMGALNSPVAGRPPFQRTAGIEMGNNLTPPAFSGLEPFQQLPNSSEVTETKQKRSTD